MALTNAEQANGTFATPNQQTHQGTNTPSIQYAGYGVSYTLQNPANQATTTTLPSHINAQQGLATSTPLNGKGITCGQYGPHWGTTPHQTQPTQLQLTTYPTMSSNGCHPTTPLNNTALNEKTKRAHQEQAMQAFGSVTIFCDRQRFSYRRIPGANNDGQTLIHRAEPTALAIEESQTRVRIHAAYASTNAPTNENELTSVLEALNRLSTKSLAEMKRKLAQRPPQIGGRPRDPNSTPPEAFKRETVFCEFHNTYGFHAEADCFTKLQQRNELCSLCRNLGHRHNFCPTIQNPRPPPPPGHYTNPPATPPGILQSRAKTRSHRINC
ncbi:hypothetical protein OUZ56_005661 [Daphnia magna]|uniref:Uncharacterized protein n=1 Tax=Daphnia magna TaxID=35525 RepID=A0ABQ9YTD8_9CRUS|nr:hypothetical protein OUZ56_005661 [Daphnia magna]